MPFFIGSSRTLRKKGEKGEKEEEILIAARNSESY